MACNRVPRIILALLLFFNILYSFDAIDTITGTHFVSDTENKILVSSGGNFKLSFFSPGMSPARYIGIWVNEATVVWVANRENPIKNSGGIFKIGGDGNLGVFVGNESSPLWSSNVSVPTGSSTAKLLDSGNLALVAGNKWSDTETIIWQSFDHPTDTLLPGMKFGLNRKNGLNYVLTSWKSTDDAAPGESSSRVDTRGSPQIFNFKKSVPLWRAGPWNGRNFIGLPDTATGIQSHKADLSDWLAKLTLVNNENETYVTSQQKKSALFSIYTGANGNIEKTNPAREWRVGNNRSGAPRLVR